MPKKSAMHMPLSVDHQQIKNQSSRRHFPQIGNEKTDIIYPTNGYRKRF